MDLVPFPLPDSVDAPLSGLLLSPGRDREYTPTEARAWGVLDGGVEVRYRTRGLDPVRNEAR